jgi:homogentisate phytyltransferase/homogentisate geranylgeranyltransferase
MSPISSKTPPSPPVLSTQLQFTRQPLLWLRAFWKFSRPHTIIGTSLSVLGLYLIALSTSELWPGTSATLLPDPQSLLPTLLACLCGNVYIVGLNQLEDVDIDRINKPHLPLASGEFSRLLAIAIVLVMGMLAMGLAWLQGPYLLAMVSISLLLGTAYSLPPVRLKRFPFLASLCIFTVRGLVVNLGLFLHFNSVRNRGWEIGDWGAGIKEQGLEGFSSWGDLSFSSPPVVLALTLFILVFTFAIAIFKDIPDAEGDRKYQISTFTLRLGQQKVFNLARWVLMVAYGGMILAGLVGLPGANSWVLIITHLLALGLFWYRSFGVNLQDKVSISRFYQFIWKLFFIEYLMFPIVCLLQ